MADCKFQIASILVMIIIFIDYLRRKKLPLKINRVFLAFLIAVICTLAFDILSVFSINNIETLPKWLNRLIHQFFIGGLDFSIFLLFFYILILTKGNDYNPKVITKIFIMLPIFISFIMILFGELKYYIGDDGRYSYGLMAYTVYASIAIYTVLILVEVFKSKNIDKTTRFQIMSGVILWSIIAIIQGVFPVVLISSVALVMMVLFVYLSFEHPGEYIDQNTKILNGSAFELVINEKLYRNNDFDVTIISLKNTKAFIESLGYSKVIELIDDFIIYINERIKLDLFRYDINTICIISEKNVYSKKYNEILKNNYWNYKNYTFSEMFNLINISLPLHVDSIDGLYNLIHYINSKILDVSSFNDDEIIKKYKEYKKIEEILDKAFINKDFEMYYQPIFNTKKNSFTNCEALIRIKEHPQISPDLFIPLIEEKGWINILDLIVFDLVCKDISELRYDLYGIENVEINLSRKQSNEKSLVVLLENVISTYGVNPNMINLEITETSATDLDNVMLDNIKKLKKKGISFSMDDFGTGYSNLSQIAKLKFDIIKLDKSLIWPCFKDNNKDSLIILNNSVNMMRDLGVEIVAEGIETLEQASLLKDLGVLYLQGYLYSKPLEKNEFLNFIKEENLR